MKKIKFKDDEEPAIDEKTLNELQENIEEEINAKSIIIDSKEIEKNVTEEESFFMLPDNYQESTSIITVLVNNEEVTDYTISEMAFVEGVTLTNAVSNCTVKIICKNVSKGFIKFLQKNMSVG